MKIYKLSAKTWRDSNKYIMLYHVSPNHLSRLMPRSKLRNTGKVGLFLSPSYKSIILDWAHYVMGKKHENHPLDLRRRQLYREKDKLDEQKNINSTPEIIKRLEEIENELDKISKTTNTHNKEYWDSIKGYQTLFIHTIQCSIEIYKASQKMMQEVHDSDPVKSYGFWGWGAQTFIESKYLPQLEIINVKKMNMGEFQKEYKSINLSKFLDNPSRLSQKEFERQKEEDKNKEKPIDPNPNRYDHKKEMERRKKEFDKYWDRKYGKTPKKQDNGIAVVLPDLRKPKPTIYPPPIS